MKHSSEAVLNSRAGDRFHYLWAARRCLHMIHPMSMVEQITVEGSPEPNAAGEQVIDVGELRRGENGRSEVHYYQLKHSTVRVEKPMGFAEMAKTLSGFAVRYREKGTKGIVASDKRWFWFISNRPISDVIKKAVSQLAQGKAVRPSIRVKLATATGLPLDELQAFCARLGFSDDEGGYVEQEQELESEVARFNAGVMDRSATLELCGLVADQTLPQRPGRRRRGTILREHVLKVLGVTHADDLFPAPLAMESISSAFKREQHGDIVQHIVQAQGHVIIHASGGVGKSVVAQQLSISFPKGSEAIVYDCFGGGTYLSHSRPRHRLCDALVQIANELAVAGLCQPMIATSNTPIDQLLKSFLRRLSEASKAIHERGPGALLVILVDAADNAEMAAEAFGDTSFAHVLIREKVPENCRIVYLCRTERRKLLKPPTRVLSVELKTFSLPESSQHLKTQFPKANDSEAKEFHRLTGGNPRVQATCLAFAKQSLRDMLDTLGPGRVTVDEQIANQLQSAIDKLTDQNPELLRMQVEAICRGLATLPPFIPISVLAAAAGVEPDAIRSLIADLGRPLWCSDSSVQFRDEPTETWFKKRYAGTALDVSNFARALEPLASVYTYAAQSLPALWHQAGEHDKLIRLALSDDYLPENNPIATRNVRVYRLQYALKAALRINELSSAAKLALRAGEEMAGNQRQLELFKENVDLLSTLQEPHIVQEWAYKRQLYGGWKGSENMYAAALLSTHRDFHGESRNYLHSAGHWIRLYFVERDEERKKQPHWGRDVFTAEHIAEMGWACLGLDGPRGFCDYISGWNPPVVIYNSARVVISRMVDAGRFKEIEMTARSGYKCIPLVLAVCWELTKVSMFPPKIALIWCLNELSSGSFTMDKDSPNEWEETVTNALVAFAEACAFHKLPVNKIIKLLDLGPSSTPAVYTLANEYNENTRHAYARAIALLCVLRKTSVPDPQVLLPDPPADAKRSDYESENRHNSRRILDELLPLYEVRAKIVSRSQGWDKLTLKNTDKIERLPKTSSHSYTSDSRIRLFWDELPLEKLRIAALQAKLPSEDLKTLRTFLTPHNDRRLSRRIQMARIAYRHPALSDFASNAEAASREMMEAAKSPEPDERVHWLTELARAVLFHSKADASAYFDEAVEQVSKFGDELTDRWEAICSLANAGSDSRGAGPELAYRFFRCAELVGNTVAREKYWDRADVFSVMSWIHCSSAFAALSRWRDRGIGRAKELTEALANESARIEGVDPVAAFCLSGFGGPHASTFHLEICLERECDNAKRQKMFDHFVADVYREGSLLTKHQKLNELASRMNVDAASLSVLCARANDTRTPSGEDTAPRQQAFSAVPVDEEGLDKYTSLFVGLLLVSTAGITRAVAGFSALSAPRDSQIFWRLFFDRVPNGSETEFMRVALEVEQLDYFDIIKIISNIRSRWLSKASVIRFWPSFLKGVGKKLHGSLAERGGSKYFCELCNLDSSEFEQISSGIQEGIESRADLLYSHALFGFVSVIAKRCNPSEAREILSYALERIEMHLPSAFGDGEWADWLEPPLEVINSYTGLIWAALGAPESASRWEAAHCVRRLVEFGCHAEIASLISWIDKGGINAFLGNGHPFYDLHAVHYLMIGLSRGCLEDASILVPHHEIFSRIALGAPHALIQPEAAKLALKIEASSPGTLPSSILLALKQVGKSPFPMRMVSSDEMFHSPWHKDIAKSWPTKPHFGIDFDAYWIPDLVRVFRIHLNELNQLMKEVAISSLSVDHEDGYLTDPRQPMWREYSHSGPSTHHSHGSYPKIHGFDFYISYHAFMITAAKLHQMMPIVKEEHDGSETYDRWNEWISSHQITRSDGRWMSDRRDASLPSRRQPPSYEQRKDWRWSLAGDDFLDVLTAQASIAGGICVGGKWSDAQDDRNEGITVRCAFVRTEVASALANAVRTADDPECASIAAIMLDEEQTSGPPFDLLPLIKNGVHYDGALDATDPYLREMSYAPSSLHPFIVERFQLVCDAEERLWMQHGGNSPAAVCEAWCEQSRERGESLVRNGERVFASLEFLRTVCSTLDRFLIITVGMRRSDRSRSEEQSPSEYSMPSSYKAFILDSNGILKDARTHHRIG